MVASVTCAQSCDGVYDWMKFHNDILNTGFTDSDGPSSNTILWKNTGLSHPIGSPVVAYGRLYVGSYNDRFYCLNAYNGEVLWEYLTGGNPTTPAVWEGRVYFGSLDDKVYCFNALNGAKIWEYATGNDVMGVPSVHEGKVFIGSNDDKLYCLNAVTGQLIWSYTTDGDVRGCPAVYKDRVIVGSCDGKVYCLDEDDGGFNWFFTTGDDVVSSPAGKDGKIYFGSYDGKFYCVNIASGTQAWAVSTDGSIPCSPAIEGDSVFFGSYDGYLYCLSALDGAQAWRKYIAQYHQSSPSISDGKLYVGGQDDVVYCIDTTTSNTIWSYTTGYSVLCSPAIAYGKLFVTVYSDGVYCFSDEVYFDEAFDSPSYTMIYPTDEPGKPLGCRPALLSDWTAAGIVYAKISPLDEGLDTDPDYVDQGNGRPIAEDGTCVITFGGPDVNLVTKYSYNSQAPINFVCIGDRFHYKHRDGEVIPGASLPVSVINFNEDMFVIQCFRDSGRTIMVFEGFGWKGTYAAGKFFHKVLWPYLDDQHYSWMIVKWTDTSGEGFVNSPGVDQYTVVADSGHPCETILYDSHFDDSLDSDDLRTNTPMSQDWYESRGDNPLLLELSKVDATGFDTKKAYLHGSHLQGNAYLTQEIGVQLFDKVYELRSAFTIIYDIYVTYVEPLPDDPERTGWMLIGDDSVPGAGPNRDDDERFAYLALSKPGGGETGLMDLVARDRDDPWDSFTVVASGLEMGRWHTIRVECNVLTDTYDVYVDGIHQKTLDSRNPKDYVTHLSFATWDDGAGAFYIDNVIGFK